METLEISHNTYPYNPKIRMMSLYSELFSTRGDFATPLPTVGHPGMSPGISVLMSGGSNAEWLYLASSG